MKSHIGKILHKSKYILNETAKYQAVLGNDAQFEGLPDYLNNMTEADATSGSTAQPQAAATDMSTAPVTPPVDSPNADPAATTPVSAGGGSPEANAAPVEPTSPEQPIAEPPMPEPAPEPVQMGPTKDELEKQVLQLQLTAMHKMSDKIDQLEALVDTLNCKLDAYAKDVEEVKEPTHIQKFMDRKQDSYPYYLNLNDLWNNNTFKARIDSTNSGYRQSPDGGYVADFDDFQNLSPQELKQSFNDF